MTVQNIRADLAAKLKGDVSEAADLRTKYSRDTSLFERMPSLVVFPKDADDVSVLVKYVREEKEKGVDISLTGRSAGTDMTGGPLTSSLVSVFTKYMNHISEVGDGYAVTEPGVYYRDFEKATLAKGFILPSYPASRELCAMGGIVNNNSGGERTLEYGKTEKYVREIDVVLSDGTQTTFRALNEEELEGKKREQGFEGEIYRKMHELLTVHKNEIDAARPKVSKNSAGYALWNIMDDEKKTFDLSKLICGAQGTLAMMTKAKLSLVKPKEHRAMLVVFLSDVAILPDIVHHVLKYVPESFESYDDHTFKLAVRFLPQMIKQMGFKKALSLGLSFLPEVRMVLTGGVPKLVLMAEFAEDTNEEALRKCQAAQNDLDALKLDIHTRVAQSGPETAKYWTIRRESFALLRKNLRGLYASPFIDDFVVDPDVYPKFLPELYAILNEYPLIYTVAGHVGNGNFHIIPLMDVSKPEARKIILELSPRIYKLITSYHGSITGEHNDGIIRTPYLHMMFGEKICDLFAETKQIFDPLNIFNPGKKVGGTFADIENFMVRHS